VKKIKFDNIFNPSFQWLFITLIVTTIPFITTYLYLGDNWYYPIIFIVQSFLFLFTLISFAKISKITESEISWLFAWLFVLIGQILWALAHIDGDGREIRGLIGFVVKYISLFSGMIAIRYCYMGFVKRCFMIYELMILLSVLLFFMLVTGLFSFSPEAIEFENRTNWNFFLGNTNVWWRLGGTQVIRIAGWMEEPGALALLITYLLLINELTFHSKWQRIFLHFAGFLTFSLAFYISVILLLPIWWNNKTSKRSFLQIKKKKILSSFFVICIIIIATIFFVSFSLKKSDSAFVSMTEHSFERFSYDPEKGSLKGDNRFYKEKKINNIWFGDGMIVPDVTSPKAVIQCYGIIPAILLYIPILLLTIKIIIKIGFRKGIWFSSVIWANLMQRPAVDNLYIMTFFTLIYFALDYKNCEKRTIWFFNFKNNPLFFRT
jgi:hypothetical protein